MSGQFTVVEERWDQFPSATLVGLYSTEEEARAHAVLSDADYADVAEVEVAES